MLPGFAYALDGLILFYLGFSVLEKETVGMNRFLDCETMVLVLLDKWPGSIAVPTPTSPEMFGGQKSKKVAMFNGIKYQQ